MGTRGVIQKSFLLIVMIIVAVAFFSSFLQEKTGYAARSSRVINLDGDTKPVVDGGDQSPSKYAQCTSFSLFDYPFKKQGGGTLPIYQTSRQLLMDGQLIVYTFSVDDFYSWSDSSIRILNTGPDNLLGTADDATPQQLYNPSDKPIYNIALYKNTLAWIQDDTISTRIKGCQYPTCSSPGIIYDLSNNNWRYRLGHKITTTDTFVAWEVQDWNTNGNPFAVLLCPYNAFAPRRGCLNPTQIVTLSVTPDIERVLSDGLVATQNYIYILTHQNLPTNQILEQIYLYDLSQKSLSILFSKTHSLDQARLIYNIQAVSIAPAADILYIQRGGEVISGGVTSFRVVNGQMGELGPLLPNHFIYFYSASRHNDLDFAYYAFEIPSHLYYFGINSANKNIKIQVPWNNPVMEIRGHDSTGRNIVYYYLSRGTFNTPYYMHC